MNRLWSEIGNRAWPVLLTSLAVCAALWVVVQLWAYYTTAPWTRDGHVRANVVQVAPDVSGLVTRVAVVDNQSVKAGDVLFEIDSARYALAVQQAQANLQALNASLAQAQREVQRSEGLSEVVSHEAIEEGQSKVQMLQAQSAQARAALNLAQLNLARTVVRSPVDGSLNDRLPRVGDYVSTGKPVLSMVDVHSFHVEGYFEETKLPRIQIGEAVDIHIMGESKPLHGHVESLALGIEDRERSNGASLLPNVNPTFNWVRLAQRVPVRISIDGVPEGVRLVAGRTATVSIVEPGARS